MSSSSNSVTRIPAPLRHGLWSASGAVFSAAMLLSSASLALDASRSVDGSSCHKADIILENATIYAGNDVQDVVASLAIKDGRFIAVGNVAKYDCGSVSKVDMQGAFVYPGFSDAHIHLKETGYREITLDLREATSLKHAMQMVQERRKPDSLASGWRV